ncbi:hypothetical protein [Micromonospora sp. 4G55]|uniref:hypothetical protein n=1 Tax=Micromonospora sp. 4G55 TaxID=2806102 RepID=UPI001A583FE5|nr:hypothetical protein [Micromonospora sp. 4G55]MBM0256482.1 hypothetical protein [Micromonospora sp. 4G55]
MDPTVQIALYGVAGTAVAALAGVAGAVFGPLLTARQSVQLATNSRLRELRHALYLKALAYVEDVEARLDRISEPMADHQGFASTVATRGDITAELRLLAESDVLDAWIKLVDADVGLAYRENHDHTLRVGNLVGGDDPMVKDVVKAVADFRQAVRRVVGSDDSR